MERPENYLGNIEWEFLKELCQITEITPSPNLPKDSEKIEMWRDESYKIKAKITGTRKIEDPKFFLTQQEPGSAVLRFMVEGNSHGGLYDYKLKNCYISELKEKTQDGKIRFETDLNTLEIEIKTSIDSEIACIRAWYLNGPRNSFIFPRSTTRKMSQKFERIRESSDIPSEEHTKSYEMLSRDFAYIKTDKIRFILTEVPEKFNPDWSKKIGIEYRKSFGEIPNAEQREAISEIVSFILGRQLLHIGDTKYDSSGQVLEQVALSPWGENVVSVCQQPDCPPIDFSFMYGKKGIEEVLNIFVPPYLNLRKELRLKSILWRYWISRNVPIGANLPILSSALEALMTAWFRSNKSKTKGVYMPQNKFDELLKGELKQIFQKLNDMDWGDRILNRIQTSYNMGVSDRFSFFFDEIGLIVSEREEDAINARHPMAHGHTISTEKEAEKMVQMTYAYETLFHRTLLKILGYKGDYIDRSTVGGPERNIDEPSGEN